MCYAWQEKEPFCYVPALVNHAKQVEALNQNEWNNGNSFSGQNKDLF